MSSANRVAAKKVGRNDPCSCGSGKKFKFCCFGKAAEKNRPRIDIFSESQLRPSSEEVLSSRQLLADIYPDAKILDISDNLNPLNYKAFQEKNFEKNTIMLAKRQVNNDAVFTKREASAEDDLIVMFRGAYRLLPFPDLENSLKHICDMINTRLAGHLDY